MSSNNVIGSLIKAVNTDEFEWLIKLKLSNEILENDSCVVSPVFSFLNQSWCCKMYLKDFEAPECISLVLDKIDTQSEINVQFSLEMILDGMPLRKIKSTGSRFYGKDGTSWGWSDYVLRSDVLDHLSKKSEGCGQLTIKIRMSAYLPLEEAILLEKRKEGKLQEENSLKKKLADAESSALRYWQAVADMKEEIEVLKKTNLENQKKYNENFQKYQTEENSLKEKLADAESLTTKYCQNVAEMKEEIEVLKITNLENQKKYNEIVEKYQTAAEYCQAVAEMKEEIEELKKTNLENKKEREEIVEEYETGHSMALPDSTWTSSGDGFDFRFPSPEHVEVNWLTESFLLECLEERKEFRSPTFDFAGATWNLGISLDQRKNHILFEISVRERRSLDTVLDCDCNIYFYDASGSVIKKIEYDFKCESADAYGALEDFLTNSELNAFLQGGFRTVCLISSKKLRMKKACNRHNVNPILVENGSQFNAEKVTSQKLATKFPPSLSSFFYTFFAFTVCFLWNILA